MNKPHKTTRSRLGRLDPRCGLDWAICRRLLVGASIAVLTFKTQAAFISVEGTSLGAGVPSALPRTNSPESVLPRGFSLSLVAQGIELLENPSGVITHFGFLSDANETKTEPDENAFLVLDHNPGGPTPGYDYGRHFLFQGHENSGNMAYITRINLDVVNPDHRITLLTPVSGVASNTGFNSIDGSCWNPHSCTLLFTQEAGTNGGVIEMSADFDPTNHAAAGLRTLYGSLGRGGFEGIRPDDLGNLLIIEDVGGTTVQSGKNPNSFVYRFIPDSPADLSHGKLQALQVSIHGSPLVFVPVNTNHPTGDIFSDNQLLLHSPGTSWPVQWVTVHDTSVDGTGSFDANAAAKAAGATPFKRPENAQFQPGSGFRTFFFVATGDTDANAGNNPALAARGAWGSLFRVDLDRARETGSIAIVVRGDADHASFDNVTFTSKDVLLAAEDRGDTLHLQLNKLDSIWAFDVQRPFGSARLVALGRDRLATGEDNEPTGLIYSDGDASIRGLLGSKEIRPANGLLVFTQQHGENNVYAIVGAGPGESGEDHQRGDNDRE